MTSAVHPTPHPGCRDCDPAIVASVRKHHGGLPTRPAGTPSGWVALPGVLGVLMVPRATVAAVLTEGGWL